MNGRDTDVDSRREGGREGGRIFRETREGCTRSLLDLVYMNNDRFRNNWNEVKHPVCA